MTDSQSNLIDRYQQYRTRRFLANESQTSSWLPGWRTQKRRRILVGALLAIFVAMLAVGVTCHFGVEWAPLLWLPVCLVFMPVWVALRVASGRQDDAPEAVLDEFEIDQRNGARSIGFAVMQSLGLIAAIYLIFGAVITNGDNGDMVYAGGIFTLMAVLIGGCTPAMILAWTRPDPDVDDLS